MNTQVRTSAWCTMYDVHMKKCCHRLVLVAHFWCIHLWWRAKQTKVAHFSSSLLLQILDSFIYFERFLIFNVEIYRLFKWCLFISAAYAWCSFNFGTYFPVSWNFMLLPQKISIFASIFSFGSDDFMSV